MDMRRTRHECNHTLPLLRRQKRKARLSDFRVEQFVSVHGTRRFRATGFDFRQAILAAFAGCLDSMGGTKGSGNETRATANARRHLTRQRRISRIAR